MRKRYSIQYPGKGVFSMSRMNIQKTLLIVCYTLMILAVFWFSMAEIYDSPAEINVDGYMLTKDAELIEKWSKQQEQITTQNAQKSDNLLLELQQYQDYYKEQFYQRLLLITLRFSILFLIISSVFWYLMKVLQKKEHMMIAKDITSLKQYQELPKADPILKQAYQTIRSSYEQHFEEYKRIHSYLSHEQKNALALLKSNLELQDYQRCSHNIEDLTRGIEDLLTISDSDDTKLYPVDAVMVCARVCDDYHTQAKIIFNFQEDEECMILAKERWIYCAVANLVDNAVKYGNHSPVWVNVSKKKEEVFIEVIDQGIGIPKEQQIAIFHHHYRIQELKHDGYGIGLSLVQHVMNLCNGHADVESNHEQGTAFTLWFPAAK